MRSTVPRTRFVRSSRSPLALACAIGLVIVACASDDSSEPSPASSTEAVATEPQGTEPPPTDPPRTEPAATEPPTTEATTATAAPEPTGTPAVAAANPHATDAAMAVLEVGGAAVDAAAAIQTVVGLVEPQSPGIGGGAFMLHYDGDTGTITSYDGREEAPSGADPAMFLDVSGAPIGFIDATGSGRAVGTPGAVAMLAAAHDREGAVPWADLFSPAIDLASAGFTVSARMAGSLGSAEAFGESDDFLALYASPAGGLLTEGETFTNPADADTLVPVTDDGAPVANAVAPGKRPRSSMAPMLVLDEDGEVRLAVGSPGGSNIIAYVAKTIVRISDWRLRGADAIGLPNIVGRSGAVGVEGPRTIEELVAGLTALGHEINVNSSEGSGIHLLEFGPDGTVTGAADPRREGTVAVGAG